jgi:hypothetical protein
MSIKEIHDDDLLDYLMNSEYDDDISPDDLKYLLLKWKYYYRLLHGKNVMLKNESLSYKDKYEKNISDNNHTTKLLKKELNGYKTTINTLKNKKLSWKERLTGKIKITNNNENQ